jgi:hypothetical protein
LAQALAAVGEREEAARVAGEAALRFTAEGMQQWAARAAALATAMSMAAAPTSIRGDICTPAASERHSLRRRGSGSVDRKG